MKVLHVLNSKIYSGAEKVASQVIKDFEDEMTLAYCSPESDMVDQMLAEQNIRHITVKNLLPWNLKKVLRQEQPDLIHAVVNGAAGPLEELPADAAVLDAFTQRLREVWNSAYDAQEQGQITDEELTVLDDLGREILAYLKKEYRYEDGKIQPMGIQQFGSRETPLEPTAQNSVQTLGSGSGIKFRIFNFISARCE